MANFPDEEFYERRRAAEAAFQEACARHERLLKAFGNHLAPGSSGGLKGQVEELLRARGLGGVDRTARE